MGVGVLANSAQLNSAGVGAKLGNSHMAILNSIRIKHYDLKNTLNFYKRLPLTLNWIFNCTFRAKYLKKTYTLT